MPKPEESIPNVSYPYYRPTGFDPNLIGEPPEPTQGIYNELLLGQQREEIVTVGGWINDLIASAGVRVEPLNSNNATTDGEHNQPSTLEIFCNNLHLAKTQLTQMGLHFAENPINFLSELGNQANTRFTNLSNRYGLFPCCSYEQNEEEEAATLIDDVRPAD